MLVLSVIFTLMPTALLWAVAPRKPLFLFYSANLANKPELSFFNPEPELLPIAIVGSWAYFIS
jgi:hypothetical protein